MPVLRAPLAGLGMVMVMGMVMADVVVIRCLGRCGMCGMCGVCGGKMAGVLVMRHPAGPMIRAARARCRRCSTCRG